MLIFRFHNCTLCLYRDMFMCFNVKKVLYFSYTASLLSLVSWQALL